MRSDIWRVFIVLIVGFTVGALLNQIALTLALFTLALLGWYLNRLHRLLAWMRNRKTVEAPDSPGLFGEICGEVDRMRERHKRRKKLMASYLKRFQEATTAMPDAVVILSEDNEILWANRASAKLLNVRWPQDRRQRITNLVRRPEISEIIINGTQGGSVEIVSPDDEELRLSVASVPFVKKQRLFVARDTTKLHRLNQVRSDFVANVSHELKTPLTVFSGYVESLAANDQDFPRKWRPAIEQLRRQADRMQAIINDLLMLSRLEQEETVQEPQPVLVPELLSGICKEAGEFSDDKRHVISIEAAQELSVLGDSRELDSAFSNIVFNAVQYTPARGIIEIRWYRDDAGAYLEVKDSGPGIPPQHLERITERFYRVDSGRSRDTGGTGLGLAIAKHVLNRHGASLEIESELDKGSTFRCVFPTDKIIPVTMDLDALAKA